MKQYLKNKGIKVGAVVLAVVLLAAVGIGASHGRSGLFRSASGALRKPVQNVVGSVADWLAGL